MAARTQNAVVLECLSDGRRWSTVELHDAGAGLAVHSRINDLRKVFGYSIWKGRTETADGPAVYWYTLRAVPAAPPRLESAIDESAAARLEAMRNTQYDARAQGPSQASGPHAEEGGSVNPGAPAQIPPPHRGEANEPGGSETSPSSRRPPTTGEAGFRSQWIADLTAELRGIDDEIANLRSQLSLTPEDTEAIDTLLARGTELARLLSNLEAKAAA